MNICIENKILPKYKVYISFHDVANGVHIQFGCKRKTIYLETI